MEIFVYPNFIEKRLASASREELLLAAEAIVDAAICVQRFRSDAEISEECRQALIDAVFRDPSITEFLFQESAWQRH